jgi:DNA helicase II / ATP-dependent DNA helicase PcrA
MPFDTYRNPRTGDLTPQQAQAAAQYGAVLVLAGAGTGKTKTLTAAVVHRITHGGFAPSRVLAVTFTNKAAAEMNARVRAALDGGPAPSWLGTFHGLAARQLRGEPEVAGLRTGFDILDADDSRRVVKRTLRALNLAGGEDRVTIGGDPLKTMCNLLSKFGSSRNRVGAFEGS